MQVSATKAKNEFGRLSEIAIGGGAVAITRYGKVRAVLVSAEQYSAMTSSETDLDSLTAEFDGLVARMQTPAARRAAEALMDAGPAEIGRSAAVAAAGGRRRPAGARARRAAG